MTTNLGFGLGLRPDHYEAILADRPAVGFFEALTENYLVPGGKPLHYLDRIRAHYPIVLHGVSLSIGGGAPLSEPYSDKLAKLLARVDPPWFSDHLCWGGTTRLHAHELLPLPMNAPTVAHVVDRVKRVQDRFGVPFALENGPRT